MDQIENSVVLYTSKGEQLILFISGIVLSVLDVYGRDYFNTKGPTIFIVLSVYIWMIAVLTRQWPLYKRILWVIGATVFIVVIQWLR